MSGPVNIKHDRANIAAPVSFETIAHPPALLPGERLQDYEALRGMIICEVAPQSGIEWLWTMDLIELSWDIQRYRALRYKVLEMYRQNAIESALRRVDGTGIPTSSQDDAYCQIRRNAAQWHDDRAAATEIEARLTSLGFDARSIDVEVIIQAREIFFNVRQSDAFGAKSPNIPASRNQWSTLHREASEGCLSGVGLAPNPANRLFGLSRNIVRLKFFFLLRAGEVLNPSARKPAAHGFTRPACRRRPESSASLRGAAL